jgi:hypothetical protein
MGRKSQVSVAGRMARVGNGLEDSKVELRYSPIDTCRECCVKRRQELGAVLDKQ